MRWSILAIAVALSSTAQADTVTLTTGDLLMGTVTDRTDRGIVLDHPILGELLLPSDAVATIALTSADAPSPPVTTVDNDTPPPTIGGASDQALDGWDGSFEAGFTAMRGNSETLHLRIGLNAKKENDRHRWTADSAYYLSRDDEDTTKNDFTAGLLKDWLRPDSPWFYFAQGRYDYDEFEAWQQRISGTSGVGYQVIRTDKLDILMRAGFGGAYEFGDVDELRPEAQLGGEVTWAITDRQSLQATTYYYPNLSELGRSRTRSTLAWLIEIDQLDGISLKIGLENEYESETEDDSKHNDLKVFSALVIGF